MIDQVKIGSFLRELRKEKEKEREILKCIRRICINSDAPYKSIAHGLAPWAFSSPNHLSFQFQWKRGRHERRDVVHLRYKI